jgi:hypothetical protein
MLATRNNVNWSKDCISRWGGSSLSSSRNTRGGYFLDDDDDEIYDTRYVGTSDEERELKNMANEEYYDVDDKLDKYRPPQNSRNDAYEQESRDREEPYLEEEEEEEGSAGNYWSNPVRSTDMRPSPRPRRDRPPSAAAPPERRYRTREAIEGRSGDRRPQKR